MNCGRESETILDFLFCHFTIPVIFLVPPTITSSPKDKIVDISIYSETTLTCKADGVPTPKIIWKKEGNNTILPSVDGTLTLTKLKPGDIGKYNCIAFNTEGNVSASVHLMLQCKDIILLLIEHTVHTYCTMSCIHYSLGLYVNDYIKYYTSNLNWPIRKQHLYHVTLCPLWYQYPLIVWINF